MKYFYVDKGRAYKIVRAKNKAIVERANKTAHVRPATESEVKEYKRYSLTGVITVK